MTALSFSARVSSFVLFDLDLVSCRMVTSSVLELSCFSFSCLLAAWFARGFEVSESRSCGFVLYSVCDFRRRCDIIGLLADVISVLVTTGDLKPDSDSQVLNYKAFQQLFTIKYPLFTMCS